MFICGSGSVCTLLDKDLYIKVYSLNILLQKCFHQQPFLDHFLTTRAYMHKSFYLASKN